MARHSEGLSPFNPPPPPPPLPQVRPGEPFRYNRQFNNWLPIAFVILGVGTWVVLLIRSFRNE